MFCGSWHKSDETWSCSIDGMSVLPAKSFFYGRPFVPGGSGLDFFPFFGFFFIYFFIIVIYTSQSSSSVQAFFLVLPCFSLTVYGVGLRSIKKPVQTVTLSAICNGLTWLESLTLRMRWTLCKSRWECLWKTAFARLTREWPLWLCWQFPSTSSYTSLWAHTISSRP